VVVADPLLPVSVQHHADVVAAICQDDAGLAVGYDAAADFGRHLIVLPDVRAVVAHAFLRSGAALVTGSGISGESGWYVAMCLFFKATGDEVWTIYRRSRTLCITLRRC